MPPRRRSHLLSQDSAAVAALPRSPPPRTLHLTLPSPHPCRDPIPSSPAISRLLPREPSSPTSAPRRSPLAPQCAPLAACPAAPHCVRWSPPPPPRHHLSPGHSQP